MAQPFSEISNEYSSQLGPEKTKRIMDTLRKNKGVNFVDRILKADQYPSRKNEDGSFSTHEMGTAEVDGKSIAFPTIFFNKETNSLYTPQDPVREAIKRGEFISFDTPSDAEMFANNGYKVGFNKWKDFNNSKTFTPMATKETDFERQKRLAAEQDEFARWQAAYRAEQDIADQWGGGLINGRPASVVVPNDSISDGTQVPLPGQEGRERAARTAALTSNPDLVYANAEQISQEMAPQYDDNNKVVAQAYNRFMADRGIDPNTIGGARLETDASGNRRFNAPSIDEEYEAINLNNRVSGQNARTRIAANRLRDRNPLAAAELMNDLTVSSLSRGGRSAEARRAVALDYLQQQRDRLQREQSNGFSTPQTGIGPRRYWDRVANYV